MFTHWYGLVLTFQEEEIDRVDLGPSEVTAKIQTKFQQSLLFTTPSLFSQGAGRKACSHSPSGFFWSFLRLSQWEFGAFGVKCESREAQSHLELLGRHVVNFGLHISTTAGGYGDPLCNPHHPPCGVGLGAAAGLALCTACSVHGQDVAATFLPSRKSCPEGDKPAVSSKRDELLSHRTPSCGKAQKCYWNEIAGKQLWRYGFPNEEVWVLSFFSSFICYMMRSVNVWGQSHEPPLCLPSLWGLIYSDLDFTDWVKHGRPCFYMKRSS